MKPLTTLPFAAAALAILAVLAAGLLLLLPGTRALGDAALGDGAALLGRLDALHERLTALEQRLRRLEANETVVARTGPTRAPSPPAFGTSPSPQSSAAAADRAAAPGAAFERDARWYLEQYVLSFEGGGEGSEYYRLVTEAHVLQLVGDICAIAAAPDRPAALRLSLVRMLATARLRGDVRVVDALLGILRQNELEPLTLACLEAFRTVATADAAPQLEALVWSFPGARARRASVQALLQLVGPRANDTILRLLASAPDEVAAAELVRHVDGAEPDAALQILSRASQMAQPVRLAGAQQLAGFDGEAFRGLARDWLQVETDPQVRKALQAAVQQQQDGAGWSAKQAIGPPDADPSRDDPKAWAPREPEMGRQWLEVRFARPEAATGARIYEVNAPGAVCELHARDQSGTWHELWRGTARAPAGRPLELRFPPTTFAVHALRVVLDTNRTSGWNEIDAVELLGASGSQFAASAAASSSYAQRGSGAGVGALDGAPFGPGIQVRRR